MDKVTGLNHVTFAVRDLKRSVEFYSDLLGFAIRMRGPSSAYLEAGTLWLALVVDNNVKPVQSLEYSHVAFSVSPSGLAQLVARLKVAGVVCWQETDTQESFYFLDPDGHKLEIHSGDLRSRLATRAALREPGVAIYD
jgi:catechol 2,3-dioxygenase-like lactoylglutathione lyase family enzyme